MEDESPDSLTTRDDSSPAGDDDNVEPPHPNEDTETHTNARRGLAFGNPEEEGRSAEEEKKHKQAANAKTMKTSNKQPNRTLQPAAPTEDGQAAGASANNGTDAPIGNTGANAVTPARPT